MTANARRLSPAAVQRLVTSTEPWLSCEDCFELLDEYVEARLADASAPAPAMDVHMAACPACAEEAASLTVLVAGDDGIDPEPALRRIGTNASER
jgi:anti-sigma factor RsiW